MGTTRYSRQSFLGKNSEEKIGSVTVGIVGSGGGGSHIVQQLAHLGFKNYIIFDSELIEDSNLNRTVGANEADVLLSKQKIDISTRLIRGLQLTANIRAYNQKWQDNPLPLRECDIILGGVDGFAERRELEACARRYLIPFIDIGMTVKHVLPEPPRMSGQVFLSMPGCLCMTCVGIISETNLAQEAANYGDAGPRPQVIWANGVLASTAIGLVVDLVTGWTYRNDKVVYLMYDGNDGTVQPHQRLRFLDISARCPHYPDEQVGEPVFRFL